MADSPAINADTGEPQSPSGWLQDDPAQTEANRRLNPQRITIPVPKPDLSPQSTGNLNLPDTSNPAPPKLQDVPKAPNMEFREALDVFKNPAVVLAGLGSLFTRRPLTTAMNAAAEAMNGYQQGQEDTFKLKQKEWEDATKAALEQNNIELEKYKEAWDLHDRNATEAFAKLYAQASGFNDPTMQAAVKSGKFDIVEKLIMMREQGKAKMAESLELHQANMEAQQDLLYGPGGARGAASEIVDGMERGDQPPTLTGLSRNLAGPVRAMAAERHMDLAKMQLDWTRAQKQIQTLNGPQMTRFFNAARSVVNTIDEVDNLAKQMNQGGMTGLNYIKLQGLIKTRGNTPEGRLATKYVEAVNTLKEEFASLAQGGGVPTEPAWQLANEQVNGNYGVDQLGDSLKELQRLINFRMKAVEGVDTLSPAAPNKYVPGSGPAGGGDGWSVTPVQ